MAKGARRLMTMWVAAAVASAGGGVPLSAQSDLAIEPPDVRLSAAYVSTPRVRIGDADTLAFLRSAMVRKSAQVGGAVGTAVGAVAGVVTLFAYVPLSQMGGCMAWNEREDTCELPTIVGLPVFAGIVGGTLGRFVGVTIGTAIGSVVPIRRKR